MQEKSLAVPKTASKNRVQWVDALKMIGMFEIFWFHNLDPAGTMHSFFFSFLGEMYFLMSGFFSDIKEGESFFTFVWKKFKSIMIPYFSFAILCEIVLGINNEHNLRQILLNGKNFFLGIRLSLPAQALWFLSCFFVITVIYRALLMLLRNKYLTFIAAFLISGFFPYTQPSWFWNFDSALHYLVFYATGHLIFSWVCEYRFQNVKRRGKMIYAVLIAFSLAFSVLTYTYNIYFPFTFLNIQLPALAGRFYKVFVVAIMAFLHIQLAMLVEDSALLSKLGKASLIFCGTETVSGVLVTSLLAVFGVTVEFATPLSAAMFSVICLCVSWLFFVPMFRKYFPWVLGKWGKSSKK